MTKMLRTFLQIKGERQGMTFGKILVTSLVAVVIWVNGISSEKWQVN